MLRNYATDGAFPMARAAQAARARVRRGLGRTNDLPGEAVDKAAQYGHGRCPFSFVALSALEQY
jgi:hypothetical protein